MLSVVSSAMPTISTLPFSALCTMRTWRAFLYGEAAPGCPKVARPRARGFEAIPDLRFVVLPACRFVGGKGRCSGKTVADKRRAVKAFMVCILEVANRNWVYCKTVWWVAYRFVSRYQVKV